MKVLKAEGKIKVDVKAKRLTVEMSRDFTDYYIWFLERKYWIRFNSPRYGTHITVINKEYHSGMYDWNDLKSKYHNKTVSFEYDEDMVRGGAKKGFIMFYMKVYSKELDQIKKTAGIKEGDKFKGLHITVATAGKSGSKIVDYWPQGITIAHQAKL